MSPRGSSSVAGIVLAAGASRRMGGARPKQLREIAGEPMVRRVAAAALASRLGEVTVVLGHAARAVAEALAGLDLRLVENPRFRLGQSTSVRAGLEAVAPGAQAALFLPADQPWLSSRLIDRLIEAHAATGGPIVVPAYRGRRGAPVLFDRSLFAALSALEGDTGGRSLLPRYPSAIVEVPVDDPRELADVDTEADLERLGGSGPR